MGTLLNEKDHFMKLAALGEMSINVTPTQNPEILNVDIGCENRKDVVSMQTNKDETVDQFCLRIRSMLRAMANGEPRILPAEQIKPSDHKDKTWIEQKATAKRIAKVVPEVPNVNV